MNTTENQIEVSEVCETSDRFTVDLIPASELTDGAEMDVEEITLSAEMLAEEREIEAIEISAEGLRKNAKLWRMRDWVESQIAPQRQAIQHARALLFRGIDEREFSPTQAGLHRALSKLNRIS